jgi:hypothetical protein
LILNSEAITSLLLGFLLLILCQFLLPLVLLLLFSPSCRRCFFGSEFRLLLVASLSLLFLLFTPLCPKFLFTFFPLTLSLSLPFLFFCKAFATFLFLPCFLFVLSLASGLTTRSFFLTFPALLLFLCCLLGFQGGLFGCFFSCFLSLLLLLGLLLLPMTKPS